jgi:hypothetical protein
MDSRRYRAGREDLLNSRMAYVAPFFLIEFIRASGVGGL